MKTGEAESLRDDCLFKNAQKFYHQWVMMKYWGLGIVLLFVLSSLVIIIGGFSMFMDALIYLIVIILIIIIYPIVFKNRITSSKKCEEYVTNKLRKQKDEQERKNRIKGEAIR